MSDDNAPRCPDCGNRHYGNDCGVLIRKAEPMGEPNEKTLGQIAYEDCCQLFRCGPDWNQVGDDRRAEWERLAEVKAHDATAELKKRIAELERSNKILELKNSTTLANNLCPDHRDKQVGKPCLACRIADVESQNERLRKGDYQLVECDCGGLIRSDGTCDACKKEPT